MNDNKEYLNNKLKDISRLLLEGNVSESIWLVGKCIGFLDNIDFESVQKVEDKPKKLENINKKFAPIMTLDNVMDYEKESLVATLKHYNYNRTKTAAHLGISERTIYRRIKEYNL